MSKMADALDVVSLSLTVAAGVAACVNVCCVLRLFVAVVTFNARRAHSQGWPTLRTG